jgi:succinoglycan biosynthesis transport protein ExoP
MKIAHVSEAPEGRMGDIIIRAREVVRRRWLTLALVSAALFALGVVLIYMMTPQYTSGATVRIDPSRNPLAAGTDPGATLTPEAIETEVSSIRSLELAREVVRKLRLTEDPEYGKGLNDRAEGPALTPAEKETAIANGLLRSLSVGRDKLSYILSIKFTSKDAVKSARVANAFAEGYIETKTGSKAGSAERQTEWFKQQLTNLGAQVEAADARVAQYRAQAGIVSSGAGIGSQGTMADQQVGPLSSQLATAQSDAAALRANLDQARRQIAGGHLDRVSEVLNSPVIGELRRQRAEVLRSVGEVQARYGEKHPESIRVRDQLAAVDAQIREEAQRVVAALSSSAAAADARAASLRSSMGQLESQRAANTRNSVLADSLEREAASKRAAYEKLSQMSLDSAQAAQNKIALAEIVDRAQPPSQPTSPNKPLLITLAFIISLAAGASTIGVQEMMVTGFRTVDEIEQQLGVPLLAAIPNVPRNNNPADLLIQKPTSMFAESLRIARASILGVRSVKDAQVIAITSALPSEGKTTTALAFARTLAISNAKTLLLECDVRRAAMRPLVANPSTGPGIVEVLHGEASAAEAINPGDVPGLDHLLVRAPYFSSEDLFGNGRMEDLIAELRSHYELIVLDLPPLVGLADGRFIAAMADAVAVAVKWDATPTAAVISAMSSLRADNANVVGVLYTMVDQAAEAIGGLYYSKKYSNYYQTA